MLFGLLGAVGCAGSKLVEHRAVLHCTFCKAEANHGVGYAVTMHASWAAVCKRHGDGWTRDPKDPNRRDRMQCDHKRFRLELECNGECKVTTGGHKKERPFTSGAEYDRAVQVNVTPLTAGEFSFVATITRLDTNEKRTYRTPVMIVKEREPMSPSRGAPL